jgi:hypothetical protein
VHFLMGVHSTLFGPVKFACCPKCSMSANSRVAMAWWRWAPLWLFCWASGGRVAGGHAEVGHRNVAIACVAMAVLGRLMAAYIPAAPATDPGLKINWNPVTETWRNLKLAHGNVVVFRSLLGISWMWFFGAVFLSQFPSFAKEVLHGNEQVASLLLVVFSIGIGTGSLLCEVLSRRHVEIGLVPLGAIGMSVFSVDLYFASKGLPPVRGDGPGCFSGATRALACDGRPGLAEPVCRLVQRAHVCADSAAQPAHAPRPHHCGQQYFECAVHDCQLGDCRGLAQKRLHHSAGFLFTGLANAVVAFHIFLVVPEYLLRFVAWVLSHFIYRFKVRVRRTFHGRCRDFGLQPREFCGCRAVDGGQPTAYLLHHGPPHFQGAGAGLAVQAGQGHSHCPAC